MKPKPKSQSRKDSTRTPKYWHAKGNFVYDHKLRQLFACTDFMEAAKAISEHNATVLPN